MSDDERKTMPNVDIDLEATFDKENGPMLLTWTIAKQFSRLSAEYGRDRAELYLEKALENVVKGYLDKFTAELLDDYNGAAKWLGVLDSGDPLTGAAQAANDQLGECIKLVEHATNRADKLAAELGGPWYPVQLTTPEAPIVAMFRNQRDAERYASSNYDTWEYRDVADAAAALVTGSGKGK